MAIAILIILALVVVMFVLYGNAIDKGTETYRRWQKDEYEQIQEDKAQEEYLRNYTKKKQEKKPTIKDRVIGIITDVIMAVCTAITKFLLWIQNRR